MMTPTLHLNGSSKERLLEDNLQARRLLLEAARALQEAAPHGRDYYVQGGAATQMALAEHHDRMVRIQSVINELDTICLAISDQEGR
jgi:hypothetical protein